ncbi:valine--tRNA ligase, mitochondrial [Patagioenas fasciata]|uniref:valine--tRNA ligase, mitochondrial n=1 Tax=Patagioenas fasciata TaxID=372321 RepID=UPI003A99EA5F
MAAPTLLRAVRCAPPRPLGAPRGILGTPQGILGSPRGGLGSPRARSSGAAPGDPERTRLSGREQKRKRLRMRSQRERPEKGGEVAPPPPMGWTPEPGLDYEHPLGAGGRKATGVPLPPSYSPRYVEAAWSHWWEGEGFFTPPPSPQNPDGGDPKILSMVLPPPNVTGSLHLGHALGVTLQDVLARWRRMQGWTVLWLPGTDHAGIATQAVVERWLWQRRGLRRQDVPPEQLLEAVWDWRQRHGDQILQQLRALGASLDWSRCTFTMDPAFSGAVTGAFVRLHHSGLIRRDQRLVTWSCALQSALADVEVEWRELSGPTSLRVPGCPQPVTFGVLVTFAYPVEGEDDLEVPVATTRPETTLGDVAVAVNPGDPRYTHLHGRRLRHPITGQLLPLITDPSVEPGRGTGAVKVTPGHSPQDLLLARSHGLPVVTVIGDDGTLCPPDRGWLQGVHRFAARPLVVEALANRGLFRGTQDHPMTLPLCSRSGDVVEYLMKSQWFLRCREMAERAREAVTSGRLQLIPKFHEKNWKTWMDNVGDWCLSRQLCWGHRVPAYWAEPLGGGGGPESPPPGLWVVGATEGSAHEAAARALRCPLQDLRLHRDPDVLDTWFSSALFPFAALGWPHQSPDLGRFYPNSLLVTGSDLLFFWVSRMVMLGLQLTGQLPFAQVLLHSLVRDAHGRKMSKSLGNVIDPRDVIAGATPQELRERLNQRGLDPRELALATDGQRREFPHGIPECGADALRMALCAHNVQGADVRLSVPAILAQRRFCNKVWNALRFVLGTQRPGDRIQDPQQVQVTDWLSRWALSRLAGSAQEASRALAALEPQGALLAVQSFWLRSFCDVYLEASKRRLCVREVRVTLLTCADLGLRLLAPFAPFLTEELWQRLPHPPGAPPTLSHALFPDHAHVAQWRDPRLEADVAAMLEVARAVRGLRDILGLRGARPPVAVLCPAPIPDWLPALGPALQVLAGAGSLELLPPGAEPPVGPGWVGAPAGNGSHVFIGLQGLLEPSAARTQIQSRVLGLQRRLRGIRGTQASGGTPASGEGTPESGEGTQASGGTQASEGTQASGEGTQASEDTPMSSTKYQQVGPLR